MMRVLHQAEFFFDDVNIESAYRLQRVVHPPTVLPEPVLRPDRPWESRCVALFGTALYDSERKCFRMWYQTFAKRGRVTTDTFVCLAESEDGLHWEKPALGLVPYAGCHDTNIVLAPPVAATHLDSPSVIFDDRDRREDRRYKLRAYVHHPQKSGSWVAFSPDGVHWTWQRTVSTTGDRQNLCPVRIGGRFVSYCRIHGMMNRQLGRICAVSQSRDFLAWTEPKLTLAPDLGDPPEMQFYAMAGFPMGGQFLGWVQRLWSASDTLDIELVSSRDGLHWQRIRPRQTFLPLGPAGSWCASWMDLPSNGPIERNGEWNWFVSGRSSSHFMGEPHPYGAIGVATQRAHRAVSISADQWPGRLTTRELTWHGGELQVLWDSTLITHGTPGKVTVSILKDDGTPEKGFAAATVGPADAEGWRSVEWTRGNRMGNFKGKRIRIEFVFERSRLYAYREGFKT